MLLCIDRWVFHIIPLEFLPCRADYCSRFTDELSSLPATNSIFRSLSLKEKKPLLVIHLLRPKFHGSLLLNFDRVLTASSVALFASQPDSQQKRQFDIKTHDWVFSNGDTTLLDSNWPESGWITKIDALKRYSIRSRLYRPIGRPRSDK